MEYLHYPNESAEYRAARNALLDDEIALRKQIEAVAAKRRSLPLGGKVPEDYVFERIGKTSMPENVKLSELFGPHATLILYSFMYGPERELPCPGCTQLLDGLDGAARHVGKRVRSISSPNRQSHVSPPGHTNVAGNTFPCCQPRAIATTRITLGTRPSFLGGCARNIEFRRAKTGMKQSSTFSGSPTAQFGTSGALR
jgi:hypothetical protein